MSPLAIIGILAGVYVVMSIITYIQYAIDKRRSQSRRLKAQPRIPERTLHTLEALGGWPGALVAQRTLRHKNAKRPYQIVYWAIVVVHMIALGVFGVVLF